MRARRLIMLAAAAGFLALGCQSNPDGCPRAALDSPRRCKRLCVLTPGKIDRPLPCTCADNCLCWRMPGHVRRPGPPESD
jgi:hypothetical protein